MSTTPEGSRLKNEHRRPPHGHAPIPRAPTRGGTRKPSRGRYARPGSPMRTSAASCRGTVRLHATRHRAGVRSPQGWPRRAGPAARRSRGRGIALGRDILAAFIAAIRGRQMMSPHRAARRLAAGGRRPCHPSRGPSDRTPRMVEHIAPGLATRPGYAQNGGSTCAPSSRSASSQIRTKPRLARTELGMPAGSAPYCRSTGCERFLFHSGILPCRSPVKRTQLRRPLRGIKHAVRELD